MKYTILQESLKTALNFLGFELPRNNEMGVAEMIIGKMGSVATTVHSLMNEVKTGYQFGKIGSNGIDNPIEKVQKFVLFASGSFSDGVEDGIIFNFLLHNIDHFAGRAWEYYCKYNRDGPFYKKDGLSIALQRMLIDKTKEKYEVNMRPIDYFIEEMNRKVDNGHMYAGNYRDLATRLMKNAALVNGRTLYEINPSTVSDNDNGDYSHISAQDLHAAMKKDKIRDDSIIAMTDVDYYIDDVSFFSKPNPFLISTFNPIDVSGNDADCHFRIINNEVHYAVGGGGVWKHKVWDWSAPGEFLAIERTWKGDPIKFLLKLIGFRSVMFHKIYCWRPFEKAKNRCFVYLQPSFSCIFNKYLENEFIYRWLQRVKYEDNARKGWNSIVSDIANCELKLEDEVLKERNDNLTISLGRAGDDLSIRISKKDYDVLMGFKQVQGVSNRMRDMDYDTKRTIPLFLQYFEGTCTLGQVLDTSRIMKRVGLTNPHVFYPIKGFPGEGKATFRNISNPLLNENDLVPDLKCPDTMIQTIDKRVTSQINNVIPPTTYSVYAEEFVECLLYGESKSKGIPYSIEEVMEKLDKNTQQALINQCQESMDLDPTIKISSFIKKETTKKSPRIISGFTDFRFIMGLSAFTLKFRDEVLHNENNQHWFTPGKNPKKIVNDIRQYAERAGWLIEGDFTNMDGTVSKYLQDVVMAAPIMRWVNCKEKGVLKQYLDGIVRCKAVSKLHLFKYDAGPGVKSGSPTTCDFNTILNAFLMYVAIRKTELRVADKMECFKRIGPCFGDDSVFEEKYAAAWIKVVKEVGMELKVVKYDETMGLRFLGRVYIDPYNSDTTMQDMVRTFRKIHLTGRSRHVPLPTAAVDRCSGFLASDKFTPGISTYCNSIIKYYKSTNDFKNDKKRDTRGDKDSESPYWLKFGENDSWPQDEKDRDAMFQILSNHLGLEINQVKLWDEYLANIKDPFEIQPLQIATEYYHKECIEIDGEIGTGSLNKQESKKENENLRSESNHRGSDNIFGRGSRMDNCNKPRNEMGGNDAELHLQTIRGCDGIHDKQHDCLNPSNGRENSIQNQSVGTRGSLQDIGHVSPILRKDAFIEGGNRGVDETDWKSFKKGGKPGWPRSRSFDGFHEYRFAGRAYYANEGRRFSDPTCEGGCGTMENQSNGRVSRGGVETSTESFGENATRLPVNPSKLTVQQSRYTREQYCNQALIGWRRKFEERGRNETTGGRVVEPRDGNTSCNKQEQRVLTSNKRKGRVDKNPESSRRNGRRYEGKRGRHGFVNKETRNPNLPLQLPSIEHSNRSEKHAFSHKENCSEILRADKNGKCLGIPPNIEENLNHGSKTDKEIPPAIEN